MFTGGKERVDDGGHRTTILMAEHKHSRGMDPGRENHVMVNSVAIRAMR